MQQTEKLWLPAIYLNHNYLVDKDIFASTRKTSQMNPIDLNHLFHDSLDTFKAFENLDLKSSGANQESFPGSVWQILNHLIIWQEYQLKILRKQEPETDIHEGDTWIKEKMPPSEEVLQVAVEQFKEQSLAIKAEIAKLPSTSESLGKQLKTIQDLTLHLSFHLGEVVLIRRIQGSYPLPHQMKAFLAE
jgi:uncharacterized damage-inducible protein DinB